MDVEQRMNLSLEDIIKQSGAKKPGKRVGKNSAGKGGVKVANLSNRKRAPGGAKRAGKQSSQKPRQALGLQNKGLKRVQKGGTRTAVPVRGASKKAAPSTSKGRRGKDPSNNRTVSLPRLTDLRVTIKNDKALRAQARPQVVFGYQPPQSWASAPQQMVQQLSYGYGPRNLQPQDAYAAGAPEVPVRRTSIAMDFGVSRRTLDGSTGTGVAVRRRVPSYPDYDTPGPGKSVMRMDNGR